MKLGDLILQACQSRDLSLARVCARSGLAYSTLHSQIRNNREIPFSTIDRLAATLDLPLSHFAQTKPSLRLEPPEINGTLQAEAARALADIMERHVAAMAQHGYQIGTDDVLDWLTAHEGRLENHDWLKSKINLYERVQPGDTFVRLVWLGQDSLTAKYFRLMNMKDYTEMVAKLSDGMRAEILAAHIEAESGRYLLTDRTIDETTSGAKVIGTYRRLLAPVTDPTTGQELTLSFSKLTHFSGR